MKTARATVILLAIVVVIVLKLAIYVIPEGQQAVITQFGKPVRAVTEAGPRLRLPFIQEVNRLEKRLLPWDGDPQDMPTKDKRRISIDVWARWQIVDPMKFYRVVGTIDNGQQRLDELVDSAVRGMIAKNDLIDAVRTTDDPLVYESEELEKDWAARRERVTTGRLQIEKEIKELASEDLGGTYGMELVDVHIKRINYVESVRAKVYERMSSERYRIASLYESEAQEQKNRILGQTKKELDEIQGEMQQRSAEIRGEADAKVIEITAKAFGKSPEFYQFMRQLEAYKNTLGRDTRLILSTDNEFLNQLTGTSSGSE
ncbi:MAG: protease modulator HflC [Phycisphaerales bacterium]|nr:MAG: protease modulator HflC [Phycisphaerales bacterium]